MTRTRASNGWGVARPASTLTVARVPLYHRVGQLRLIRLSVSPRVFTVAGSSQSGRCDVRMSNWPTRRWVVAAVAAIVVGLAIGIPTGIVRTSFYTRMTPVLWWNYPVWAVTAMLSGLVAATYVRTAAPRSMSNVGVGGGILSLLAVGCPICNKLVVMAVGVTGALNVWAPLQPLLGVFSVGLLVWALARRLQGERACPVRTQSVPSVPVD